jgi:hypothetical protein
MRTTIMSAQREAGVDSQAPVRMQFSTHRKLSSGLGSSSPNPGQPLRARFKVATKRARAARGGSGGPAGDNL